MKTARFPWTARDNRTLDPKHLNEDFRKGADYIRDTLELQYAYSALHYNLEGVTAQQPSYGGGLPLGSEESTFLVAPPGDAEIIGAELTCSDLTSLQNVYIQWVGPAEFPTFPVASAVLPGPPSTTPVVFPVGGPTEKWRYVEAAFNEKLPVVQSITQRRLGIDLDPPLGIYAFVVRTDAAQFDLAAGCSLTLWIRCKRGVNPVFDLPDMFNGSQTADADKFNSIHAELDSKRAEAVSSTNNRAIRGEAFVVNGCNAEAAGPAVNMNQKMYARFMSINTNSGADWFLHSYHMQFISDGDDFSGNANIRMVHTSLQSPVGAPVSTIGAAQTMLDAPLATPFTPNIKVLYRTVAGGVFSLPAAMSDTVGAPTAPETPADDWYFDAVDTWFNTNKDIKRIIVYLWYVNQN